MFLAMGVGAAVDPHAHLLIEAPVFLGMTLAQISLWPRVWLQYLYLNSVSEGELARLRTAFTVKSTSHPKWRGRYALNRLLGLRDEPVAVETLEGDYFDLILAAIRLPLPEAAVDGEIRAALRQIGEAVASIQRSTLEEDRADAADLIGDAEMLAGRARREADVVVAGSLLRQAQAKLAQARMVEKNVTLRRRTRALSAELRAQIAAAQSTLRNLSSRGVASAESNGSFRAIAASVRTLATEANSVADAREELADAMGETPARGGNVQAAALPARGSDRGLAARSSEVTVLENRRAG